MATRKIAVFDPQLKLIAVSSGISQLAKLMGVGTGEISRAIRGERVCCKGFYIRYIPKDIMIDVDDIGNDELLEFDLEQCGVDRLIYATRTQKKTGILLESEFVKIRGSKYKHYSFTNKVKPRKVRKPKPPKKKYHKYKESNDPW